MTIRTRLLLLALLATLLPAGLELSRFLDARQDTIDDDTARLVQMADQQAKTIAERIQGTAQLLYGLSRTEELTHRDSRDVCSRFLLAVPGARFMLFDLKGMVLASSRSAGSGNPCDRQWRARRCSSSFPITGRAPPR